MTLLFYKTCAPRDSDRELARVLGAITERRIHNETVKAFMKWLRRARQAESQPDDKRLWLLDLSRAPHLTGRKVYIGAIHAVLYGLGFQWTWPPGVFKDQRKNNRPLNS